jgi:hypothetical protein
LLETLTAISYVCCDSQNKLPSEQDLGRDTDLNSGRRFGVRNRPTRAIFAGAAALLFSSVFSAQTPNQSKLAGTAPDLAGVWQIDHFQANLFPKADAPFTPWRAAQFKLADTQVNDPNLACLPHGIPRLMFVPLPMEIFQVPGKILIYQEGGNQLRQIHLDRQHPKEFDQGGFVQPANGYET